LSIALYDQTFARTHITRLNERVGYQRLTVYIEGFVL